MCDESKYVPRIKLTIDGGPWCDWVCLDRERFQQGNPVEHESLSGVYIVRATLANGKPVTIHRACGADKEGWLYVGEGYLCGRIGYLMNIWKVEAKAHHHFTGTFDYYDLNRIASREHLQVTWKVCPNTKEEERRLIEEYKKEFGDIPPGNLKVSG